MLDQQIKDLLIEHASELSVVEGNILSAARDKEIKTILVTSCNSSEGKTVSAISMAYALATRANSKIVLVDGNPYSPKLHQLFRVPSYPGLSDLLLTNGEHLPDYHRMLKYQLLKPTEYQNLAVLPYGTKTPHIFEAFETEAFKSKLMDYLKQNLAFDYLIWDGPSVLGNSDVPVIAKYFDGIILVIECERTRWEVVQAAKDQLDKVGGNILGAVLNKRKYYIPKALY